MEKIQKYNIINFTYLPWSNLWKRNQTMMTELSKLDFINRVIFVNPEIWLSNNFLSSLPLIIPSKKTSKVLTYTPIHFIPFKDRVPLLKKIEDRAILNTIKLLNRGFPYILFINLPYSTIDYVIDKLFQNTALSIFDLSDDFLEASGENGKVFISRYLQKVDIVFTVNNYIKHKYSHLNNNIYAIKNAVNFSNFNRKEFIRVDFLETIKKRGPIIGYIGLINDARIDYDILDYLVINRPDWQFVFIGIATSKFQIWQEKYSNVYYHPPVDYSALPNFMNYFDVGIVPFKINKYTIGNDLLKVYDYLAMGKPVVSTNVAEMSKLSDTIKIANDPPTFLTAIESVVNKSVEDEIEKRKEIALQNSWGKRIKEIQEILVCNLKSRK